MGGRLRSAIGLVVTSLVASILLAAAPASPAAATVTGPMPARWAPAWMQGVATYTEAEAVDVARRFDVVAEHPWVFAPHVPAMRAANPDLRLLAYVNGTWADDADIHPDSWYGRDPAGNKIRWIPYDTWLLDPASPGWRNQVAANCAGAVASSGYDGCILDNLGFGPVSYLDDKTGAPMNPATAAVYTKSEWMAETVALASHVRAANPGVPVAGNGIRDGQAYWAVDGTTQPLVGQLDFVMMENFLRGSTVDVTAFKSEADWKLDIDALAAAEAEGTPVFATTKVWVASTTAQRQQWQRYTVASFLLATDGTSRLAFMKDESPQVVTRHEPWHDLDVGAPLAPYAKVSGVFRRSFERGLAVVNPSPLAVTVPLAGAHTDSDGRVWTGSFTIEGNAGEVLVPVPGPAGVPGAATGHSADLLATTARVHGAVDPNGDATSYWFEYGPTTAYGSSTVPAGAGGGTADVAVDAALGGLTSGTAYHYRLVATNAFGTSAGSDATFTAGADQPPDIVAGDSTVTELLTGTKSAALAVALSAPTSKQVKVDYATADGSAVAGADYVAKSGSLTFQPGETAKTVNVTVNGDGIAEGPETFTLELSSPANGNLADSRGVASVLDPTPVVSVSDATAVENSGEALVSVNLSTASVSAVSVSYTTTAGTATAPADYTASSGTVIVPAGATTAPLPLALPDDVLDENDETFTVTLSAPAGATIGDGTAKVTIADDDATPTFSVTDTVVVEPVSGTVTAGVDVVLSAPSGRTVTVTAATLDGTAIAPGDYAALTSALSFNPGITSKRVSVTVIGDGAAEGVEWFKVRLSSPVNAGIADAAGMISTTDPSASISVADVVVAESAASMSFDLVLSTPSSQTISVSYATSDVTATAGSDYAASSGTLTFSPGQTTKRISLPLVADSLDEPDERLTLTLSSPVNASISDGSAKGTIQDDDALPALTVDDIAVVEPLSGTRLARFTVRLSAPSGRLVKVGYATASGSAASPADFTATSGTLSFAAGATALTVSVTVNGDGAAESPETFKLNLTAPVSATVGDAQGLGTVTDPPATLSIADVSSPEDTATFGFVVSLDTPSASSVSFSYATTAGTATAGADFVTKSGTATFAPGQTSKMVSVTVVADQLDEVDEAFTMVVSSATGASIGDGTGKATLVDDDAMPGVSVSDASVTESDSTTKMLKYVVSLSAPSGRTVKVDWSASPGGTPAATAGSDFTSAVGTITFAAGATSATVSVSVLGDDLVEADELVKLALANPQYATTVDGTGSGTIIDDD